MKRLLSAVSAIAFAASVWLVAFVPASAAETGSAMATKSPAMGSMSTGKHTSKEMKTDPSAPKSTASKQWHCKKGESYVKGYTKKDGTKVKGYCRTP